MATVLILGAGTAGTMLANKLSTTLPAGWRVQLVDKDDFHDYQPGYLFIPFGTSTPKRVRKSRRAQVGAGVDYLEAAVSRIDPDAQAVELADGRRLNYDYLVIATGTVIDPSAVEGLSDPKVWRKSAFDFYTRDGSAALHDALTAFEGGRLVIHIAEMPIKCPVAPLEFAFLADDYFRKRRIRHKVDITYVTPLDGAFTKPVASKALGSLLKDRSIRLSTDFAVERVDAEPQQLVSYDGREIPFDLLVEIPPHRGAEVVSASGLGDESGFVPIDKHTLQMVGHDRIFAVGDATNAPTSKAGAVAHFEVDGLSENLVALTQGQTPTHLFDGHANCFIESGRGEAMLLDFNYDTEPLTGVFPVPVVGPMKLLGRSRLNHLGKLAFEQIYWRMLLPGKKLPVPTLMSMAGKIPSEAE